ncbi:MAG: 3-hydroxyacyl-ACP dehydratase FabZ [Rhodospirillales bacterium]|nr:3-hydroxyacyl-ACP dehydratase FabZ [Rhodospirillales bacterium]MBO6786743.1 3-hydroxyacyl-ACP dehydratase FabZ [Rhodospirillales bacterium]
MDAETTTGHEVDVTGIMERIPHRYPFLLIDKVIDIQPGESATGIKNVSVNEPFFQGHFPGHPIMPGVLIVEAMAQTAAIVVIEALDDTASDKLVYFMSIDNARFRKPVLPGHTLHLEVTKEHGRGKVWRFKGVARADGTVMAEAVFTAMIVDQTD